MSKQNIVTVTEDLAGHAGVMCWWELTGETAVQPLRTAWLDAKLPILHGPPDPSKAVALSRAAKEVAARYGGWIAKQAKNGDWIIIAANEGDAHNLEDVTAEPKARCYIDDMQNDALVVKTKDKALYQDIVAAYDLTRSALSTGEIGGWIVGLHKKMLNGLGLRTSGGIYFVPRGERPQWAKMWEIIQANSNHRVRAVDAMTSTETVGLVSSALQEEVDAALTEMDEAMEQDDVTARKLRGRAEACEKLLARVRGYDDILGEAAKAMKQQIKAMKVALTRHELVAGD